MKEYIRNFKNFYFSFVFIKFDRKLFQKCDQDPANKPIYLVSSMSNPKIVHTVREAFNDAGFSKINLLSPFDTQNSSQFAPQIVG